MNPEELKFTESHEWVHLGADGVATVGISQFAVEQLSDLLMIELPKVGARVEGGKRVGEIESVKNVSDVYSPVAGEVVAVNEAVAKDVKALSDGPYGDGWLFKVKVDDPSAIDGLMDHAAYQAMIAEH